MYGPPEPRSASPALRVVLRVVFTVVAVAGLGLLAWAPMLRLAILRRTRLDWVLFWASAAVAAGALAMLATVDGQELPAWRENTGGILLIVLIVSVVPWFLTVDIRHHREAAGRPFGAGAPAAGGPVPPYGHPGGPVPPPYGPHPPPYAQGPAPYAHDTPPPPPGAGPPRQATPRPPVPDAPRAARVRAELDELSDLLRREQEGGR
ncbi:hypothetical protein DMB38_24770 [Streptomyces sp. WAC 06738]|uniref:hypothetical protein n=1 Tax=Streptomyces sp. WAC 06738 TaxID=2203210 RepID=UPI000F71EAB4|nr:hypothetical protein [Streptomyces sp. WAC 06738]AZM48571.1 hypothetical protein DMB38_24770 [Streptomyces sp. WAC 06738]